MDETFGSPAQERTAESRKRTVLLVDDHPVVREGLKEYINRESDLEVCGTAETGAEVLTAIARFNPSMVVLDLELPSCHGLELLQDIHARYPNLPVLIFSMHEESVYAHRALRGGARGYLMKFEPPRRLLEGIRTVLNGGYFLSNQASSRALSAFASPHRTDESPVASLGNRELEVFQFIGQGKGTREIAGMLCLSVKTVETYRERIKQKLNLKSSTEMTRQAVCWVESGR